MQEMTSLPRSMTRQKSRHRAAWLAELNPNWNALRHNSPCYYMKITRLVGLAFLSLVVSAGTLLRAQDADLPEIPYQHFTLKNGLNVLIHEDHKAPIVAVNIWYHVGSKNERRGKTGFAHLFEHLMFNGSEHFNDDYFKGLEKVGATDLNGTTSEDRTNYFQNVPKAALDFALWMESDRMGHLLGAIDQAKLDEQRGVVQNEKRQGENQPYAVARELIQHNTWPVGHPYSWTVIGSMEDLNAASLDDVKEWFKTYYGPSNATLVIAGDVNAQEALAKVEKHFGDIPPGPPLARHSVNIAKRSGMTRMKAEDRVPQARLYKVWNIPEYGTQDDYLLTLAAEVLARGKNSRLFKRLVYDEQLATDVSSYADTSEIAGQFMIIATAKPGIDLGKVETAIDEELAKFLSSGPTAEELTRVRTQMEASFIRGIERIGGFGGKSDILASNFVFKGDPAHYKKQFSIMREATPEAVRDSARTWLSDGQYVLEIHPFANLSAEKTGADRSQPPVPELKADAVFPTIQRATLSNGLSLVLAERHSIPNINLRLLVKAGYATDKLAAPGTARLALDMLDEGTVSKSSLEISRELDQIGATLSTGCNLDLGVVSLNTLKANLSKALEIYADVILNPSFPTSDFERIQKLTLSQIQREKADPTSLALRVMPGLLFGASHPYGVPYSGTGTEAAVSGLSTADLRRFHETWFRPGNSTLVIVGDTTLKEIVPVLEKLFKSWKDATVPKLEIAELPQPEKGRIVLLDRPGAQQSFILASQLALPKANPQEIAIEMMNDVLGGSFTSRINMNLREGKHWTYGARTVLLNTQAQRPFLALAPIQADKTREAMEEIRREFSELISTRPPTTEERTKAVRDVSLGLAGSWETMAAVSDSLLEIVRYKLPDSYFQTYASRLEALSAEDLSSAAKTVVRPDTLTWVVVGDRAKIEASLRELNWAPVEVLDADGKTIQPHP